MQHILSLATFDRLCCVDARNLFNKRHFDEVAKQGVITRTSNGQLPLSLIDALTSIYFKRINDSFGHRRLQCSST